MTELLPVWHSSCCVPREEVIKGKLTDAELALRLSTIVKGEAKPPYNTPESFLKATHLTRNMELIIKNVMGRLSGTKKDVNPIIVLDVGFGGGKTHTMATLYYIAKYGNDPEITKIIGNIHVPKDVNVVTISGEDYTEKGVIRDGKQISTIWGDMFHQLGKYDQFAKNDLELIIPSIDEIKEVIKQKPTLILLDEFPTYLKTVALRRDGKEMIDKSVQWIQRLVIAVSETENSVLVIAIAEDVYRQEAEKAKMAINEAVKQALSDARAHISRKETVYVPIQEEDVVYILKKRLFEEINPQVAKLTAKEYHELYQGLPVVEELKSSNLMELIKEYYPFHPYLIKVLYERLATLDRFQRTRGALRLLSRVIRKIWNEKEQDAVLIHPFHVDLADEDILTDLTTHIGEEKLRNAVEADVWKGDGTATAERLDEQAKENWKAPLIRRACNTVYLFSLATGREGDRGIRSDLLTSLLVTPVRREHFFKVRDIVLSYLSDQFHYIDKQGERFVFVREPTPIRVIDILARDVTEEDALKIIKEKLQNETFKRTKDTPDWITVEIFPTSPSRLQDDIPIIQVAILNPNIHTITDRTIPSSIKDFIEYSDDHRQHPRKYTNPTFLLVASDDRLESMKLVAKKVQASRMVRDDPQRYQIPKDRKTDIEEYLSRQEKLLHDNIRAAFLNVIYYHRDGVKLHQIRDGSGYGSGSSGYEMLKHILTKVLERVSEIPLDMDYIINYVWPSGAASITTKALYEWFYRKPGVKIPANKEIFIESIRQGIEQGLIALYQQGKIITDTKNLPKEIRIDDQTELMTPEEAEKRKQSQVIEIIGKTTRESGVVIPQEQEQVLPRWTITLSDSKAEILANDLEKKSKNEKFTRVYSATIRTNVSDPTLLQEFRNVLTRYMPEKNLDIRITGTITRSRSPTYTFTFDLEKDSAQKEEGRTLLENIWRIKGAESVDFRLKLEWNEPVKPEEVGQILRTLRKDTIFNLEAEVGKQ
ncbi:MAG: DUF499 domain-containing protein [Thermoproteota archaeon]